MSTIETDENVAEGLDALCRANPRLAIIRSRAGTVPLRRIEPGFSGLAAIVVGQQLSRASAEAIFGRLCGFVDPLTPANLLASDEALLLKAGLSRAKVKALTGLASAISAGEIDLAFSDGHKPTNAIARMIGVPGIGPWTAECYLLFAAGHPDIFPSSDIALQTAVGHGLDLAARPSARELSRIAAGWSPWRSVAARLFWAYYRTIRGREAAPPSASGGAGRRFT